jgi:hypothetical protein
LGYSTFSQWFDRWCIELCEKVTASVGMYAFSIVLPRLIPLTLLALRPFLISSTCLVNSKTDSTLKRGNPRTLTVTCCIFGRNLITDHYSSTSEYSTVQNLRRCKLRRQYIANDILLTFKRKVRSIRNEKHVLPCRLPRESSSGDEPSFPLS